MTAGVEGLPTDARDRQHRSERTCWCQPVENGIGWTHNGQDADVDEDNDGSER